MTSMKTIRQTAKLGILTEHRLRILQKQGLLPGVYCGNRFLVDVDALRAWMAAQSEQGARL